MANCRRGGSTLPDEMKTSERLSTKKELAQRKSVPPCPQVPSKILRKSVFTSNGSIDKPKPVFFSNSVELDSHYNPDIDITYFQQLYPDHSLIGEGSFGEVYKVRGAYDDKRYAIKRLKPMISFHDKYAEVRNNEKVGKHPNCVQFYMAWEEGCDVFMVLESCQMSLSDYATENSDIPEDLLWNVLYDICQALKYLHGKDLLHLDVKPGNIMMKNGYYKLADFGILVDLKLKPLSCTSTLSDGDSKYLAIEVLDRIYTPFCDIFGLGLSLLELAADLALPSHGPLWQQLRHEVLPQSFCNRVSREFRAIIKKMLNPKYDKRPTAERILNFNTLQSIEKRDKTEPRINYAGKYFDDERDECDDSDNNNVIQTPKFFFNVSSEDSRFTSDGRPKKQMSPKNLFQLSRSRNASTGQDQFSSLQPLGCINSDADVSYLAASLSDSSFNRHPMDTDELLFKDTVDDMTYLMSYDEDIPSSTPVVKNRLPKKVLTFD